MKIGTDGVLLGAWASEPSSGSSVLDIGSGTGILALMLAQRSDADTIDAVEIDAEAYQQCVTNFEASPWADRLFCYHAPLVDFATEFASEGDTYDAIISNPPFYTDAYFATDASRTTARFTDALSFEELCASVAMLLADEGVFSVIIPAKETPSFLKIAQIHQLFPFRICQVQGRKESPVKRTMIEFSFEQKALKEETLIIETDRHVYTPEYTSLTRDFYLHL